MRLAGRMRLGFFPLPAAEAKRIHRFLQFPNHACPALDPCIGDGAAFSQIASGEKVLRYGIELEANRAAAARVLVNDLLQGNCFDVQCPVESLSLIYLNPPYDFELSEQGSQRMERLLLEHVYRWLRPGGVLVLVIPAQRIGEGSSVLSAQFRDVRVYRLTAPESLRYGQIALFGVRRTRYERERLQDSEITRARRWYEILVRNPDGIQPLPSEPDHQYAVPAGERVRFVYRGLPLDQIEDLLARSSAYRQAAPILFAQEKESGGRPLTPLHGGHVGLLCTAGMLNGVFGEGEARHIANWQSIKTVDRTEEEEDGATVIRERERFSNELTLVFCTGETATLK
jgi:Uncharacterised methyltransferase family (DUF6094)